MTNKSRICHVLTPSETNTRSICHVLTPSELFVMFVLAFRTGFGNGVCSVCSLKCGFASVSVEQIEKILEDKDSENTKKSTKVAKHVFLE